MDHRKQCEFQLIRYVPDPVKNEFVNIGVVLREAGGEGSAAVRFTRDWRRVRSIDSDADTAMLEALESEISLRLAERRQAKTEGSEKPLLDILDDSLSNSLQITERKAFLAESFPAGLEQLLNLYVETARRERASRHGGRAAIQASMQSHFERAGVWKLMRKRIAAANYTRPGDPLRIDCAYRPNGVVRMFHAVSLDTDLEAAKVLAFGSRSIREGVARVEKASLELTAIVEPIRSLSRFARRRSASDEAAIIERENRNGKSMSDGQMNDGQMDDERIAEYRFAVETMEEHEIRVLTTTDLPRVAETARRELGV